MPHNSELNEPHLMCGRCSHVKPNLFHLKERELKGLLEDFLRLSQQLSETDIRRAFQ